MKLEGAEIWYFAAIDLWFGDAAQDYALERRSECLRVDDKEGAAMWQTFAQQFRVLYNERHIASRSFRSLPISRRERPSTDAEQQQRAAGASSARR